MSIRWAIFAALILLVGCDRAPEAVVVLAASSTAEPVGEFVSQRDDVDVSFAGSSALRVQIEHGAAASIFISADRRQVDALDPSLTVGPPVGIAKNRIVIAVPRSSPLRRWQDLPRAEHIILGGPEVPVGRYADRFLESAGEAEPNFASEVRDRVASREPNVRLVRSKLELGEADAAILYATDLSGRDLRTIEIPEAWSTTEGIWGVALRPDPATRAVLDELATSDVWARYGFERFE